MKINFYYHNFAKSFNNLKHKIHSPLLYQSKYLLSLHKHNIHTLSTAINILSSKLSESHKIIHNKVYNGNKTIIY